MRREGEDEASFQPVPPVKLASNLIISSDSFVISTLSSRPEYSNRLIFLFTATCRTNFGRIDLRSKRVSNRNLLSLFFMAERAPMAMLSGSSCHAHSL